MNLELFGTPSFKLVRNGSPSTSFEAAEKVDTTKLEKMVYEAIKQHGIEGCISDQILEQFPSFPYSSLTARYKALIDKNLIFIDGTLEGKSGRKQRVMKASVFKEKNEDIFR